MSALDKVLQAQFPTVLMPKFEAWQPLQSTGDRFILGANALKMEISRPWLHAVLDLTPAGFARGLPYGAAPQDSLTYRCNAIPRSLLREFEERAAQACPNEIGAWVVWNESSGEFSLLELPVISHGPEHLDYETPQLPNGCWLVMDIHSHGHGAAFFSPKDNRDDAGAVKLAAVYGRAHREGEWVVRAELLGLRVQMPGPRVEH